MNYIAEVFYEEYKFLTDDADANNIWIKNIGVNRRTFSKDVMDLSCYTYVHHLTMKEATFIHLSRNSIYHQLPEFLFHPLTISEPSMSNREVVEAIRENRKKEDESIHFFIPFDTEIFKERLKLNNRHLNIFTDPDALHNIFSIAQQLIDKPMAFGKEQFYKLFLNLCNAEVLKENLPKLEELLKILLGYKVILKYKKNWIGESPFSGLGEGVLGHTFGTQGVVEAEHDNVLATIIMHESKGLKFLMKNKITVKKILEFFILANRGIEVQYSFKGGHVFILGKNHLGYDTAIFEAVN